MFVPHFTGGVKLKQIQKNPSLSSSKRKNAEDKGEEERKQKKQKKQKKEEGERKQDKGEGKHGDKHKKDKKKQKKQKKQKKEEGKKQKKKKKKQKDKGKQEKKQDKEEGERKQDKVEGEQDEEQDGALVSFPSVEQLQEAVHEASRPGRSTLLDVPNPVILQPLQLLASASSSMQGQIPAAHLRSIINKVCQVRNQYGGKLHTVGYILYLYTCQLFINYIL